MSSESSESGVTPEIERMRTHSSCSYDYTVEYDAFLTSLRELTATPATTLKVVLDHMRRTNRPTNLLEESTLDIKHIHSFYRAMLYYLKVSVCPSIHHTTLCMNFVGETEGIKFNTFSFSSSKAYETCI